MAYELIFQSTERSDLPTTYLVVRSTQHNEITIQIGDHASVDEWDFQYICLDKESAIKLAKELRKHISFLED